MSGIRIAGLAVALLASTSASAATYFTDIGGRSWTFDASRPGMDAPPQFAAGAHPLAHHVPIMGGDDARDLRHGFTVDDFGFDAAFGPVFEGGFDPATLATSSDQNVETGSAVPELTLWSQMIAGFAVIGTAIRRRTARRAKWQGLVSRLSGRVREA